MRLWADIQAYFMNHTDSYLICVKEHIVISIVSLLIALLIGVPLGYLCTRNKMRGKWITGFFQVLRIIPSLAVLILLIPIIGTGIKPTVMALILLAVPPILMNTAAGFEEVPEFMIETGLGLGMTDQQIFRKVKVPLALPMILTGTKTALVEIIASATIAAKIGAGGLGGIILTGLGLNRTDLLLIGGISVGMLSVMSGLILWQLDKILMKYKFIKA